MTAPSFPTSLSHEFETVHSMDARLIQHTLGQYTTFLDMYGRDNGAPELDALNGSDAYSIINIKHLAYQSKENWPAFKARMNANYEAQTDRGNPWLPNWIAKTDDKAGPWVSDSGAISEPFQLAFSREFKRVTPYSSQYNMAELVGSTPVDDAPAVLAIAKAMLKVKSLMLPSLGESDLIEPEFRWGRALAPLAGLGFETVRLFAEELGHYDENWAAWATCSDAELRADVIKAAQITGYPISLLRADYPTMQRMCLDNDFGPRWITQLLVSHIFRYTRFIRNHNGLPHLVCMYKGQYSLIEISPAGVGVSMADLQNDVLTATLCKHLGIKHKSRQQTTLETIIENVLAKIHPNYFVECLDMRKRSEIVTPKGVSFSSSYELKSDFRWMDLGIEVRNIASIDVDTGKINKSAVFTGPDVLNVMWPRAKTTDNDILTWKSNLPDIATPERPSVLIQKLLRNINTLNQPAGFWALIDGLIFADLMRDDLAGSKVGNAMANEFPLCMVLPMGHELHTTTNQGKTLLAVTLGKTLVPDMITMNANRSSSPPVQRQTSAPLVRWGSAIFDEYMLPSGGEHFLAQAGLQAMATGAALTPGVANENAEPLQIRHPVFFISKISDFPPDIRNRTISCFMDVLTPETRCSDDEMDSITSGSLPTLIRLSALMWLKKNNFVEKVRAIQTLRSGPLRFPGHLTIMSLMDNGSIDNIKAYLEAAEKQCDAQQRAAQDSGLADNIGASTKFDPVWYFAQMNEDNVKMLASEFASNLVPPIDAFHSVLTDRGRRTVQTAISGSRTNETRALRDFTKAIRDGRMHRPGWEMKIVEKLKDKRKCECVMLVNLDAKERAAPAPTPQTTKTE